jgi:hypothetical protein
MTPQTIDLPPLCLRAEVGAVNDEARTVELIFSTGAAVVRYDWMSGKRYRETLSMKTEHIRLDRLNAGAPLLNAHSAWSLGDVLGTVEPDSARIEKSKGIATVRFSKREDVEPIYQDVRDKIIRSVSVGYRVHKFIESQGKNDEMPTREAVDWEPYEVSLVPMPADTGARVRAGDKSDTNPCVIVTRAVGEGTMAEDLTPEQRTQSEFIVTPNPLDPGAPAQRATGDTEPNERDLGADAERDRINGIMQACTAARLPMTYMRKLVDDKVTLVRAQSMVFEELAKRDQSQAGPRAGSSPSVQIQMGDDPFVHARKGIAGALLHRMAPQHFKLDDEARNYRGLTLLETAKIFLQARGMRVTDLSKNDVAGLALGLNVRAGYNTTSDFALLLADAAGKTLRKEYEAAPQTFTKIARRITLPDYKPAKRLQIGEAPALKQVDEHGEYTFGTIGEGRETMQLVKYGRKFAITREVIINDDTDAFSRVPQKFGRAARNLESNVAWLQILSNPAMGDGNALFSSAHGNLDPLGAAISVASIGAGRAAMRLQTGRDSDDVTFIDAAPKFLLVPPSLETEADKFVSTNLLAAQSSNVNPFGGRLEVVSEPRLEVGVGSAAGSDIAWYLAADPGQVDILEYAYLDGEEGAVIESRIGFDVDGVEIKCRLDFAAKAIDWKGLYKNHGDQSAT